jgi:hypothetical protein
MIEFTRWMDIADDLSTAERYIGRVLVALGSNNSAGLDILPHVTRFKQSVSAALEKADDPDERGFVREVVVKLNQLEEDADAAVSEPDPSRRRQMFSTLLRKVSLLQAGKSDHPST